MTSNIPDYYKEVSLRMDRVLDTVGLGEDIRWKRINIWIQSEEVRSMIHNGNHHYFGSQAEATTTPGLHSDIDRVFCYKFRVIKDLESWMPDITTFLIVNDEHTPPGYVKLQWINIHQPWPVYNVHSNNLKLDGYGRSVLSNHHHYDVFDADEYHGPAYTFNKGIVKSDLVTGMRLNTWPDQASQWLTRKRRHNWPSHDTIRLIQEMSALLVPVGHKLSQEQHLEWRLSISYGEKLLVWLFNSTQYKCYILLKIINKSFIKPVVGDDALSSYHCKTCIFYLVENTPTAMWQPDNLLLCVDLCLRLLYNWVKSKMCPNYFIPEENMFLCKVYGHVQGQLLGVLGDLLSQEGRYLIGISCDSIGHKLVSTCQVPVMEIDLQSQDVTHILRISVRRFLGNLVFAVESGLENDNIFEHHQLDRYFSSRGPRREINTILWKLHCSIIGSKLASKSLSLETPDRHGVDMAQELLLWGSSSDVASGKLKLAAFYLVQDNLDMCRDVLCEIQRNYNYKISEEEGVSQHTLQAIVSENLSTTQLVSQYFALPVLYHPSEINCIPKALIPEIFHVTESNQDNEYKQHFKKRVIIDPEFYLYFLAFLCYQRQNNMSHKNVALDNMIYVIRHKHLEYKDTSLNLLAYCLTQDGRLTNAYSVLCKSMKLKNEHSGAKWYIATLINAAFRVLRGEQRCRICVF
ncbi:hypothetical protein ACJMK2_029572 [Sinanodonta woodiana]|uniref:Mab-21-like HhH/H2TH-like domain-containing protein n=1 Tax=Sinanodonta woodiana TaxID=1069815 RepID=A0ABD3XC28_SINWO